MKDNKGRLIGILGTIIVHLIAGIIFMSFQIRTIRQDISKEFEIEFLSVDSPEEEEKPVELPEATIEDIFRDDEQMLNIARNLASETEEEIDPQEYIDMVKEELIKSGKLDIDNFIDEEKKVNDNAPDENLAYENEESDEPDRSEEMASAYNGPTRIYYDLHGRTHTHLPIPIYKCQGSGIIVLAINVNQRGVVEKANISPEESTTSDKCLTETAISSALSTRFNSDYKSPKIQEGTLTYHFVAQ